MVNDVPVTLDFRDPQKARAWTDSAMSTRPWRAEFFAAFADVVHGASPIQERRVLELGSGPGYLAEQLLRAENISYVAVDFSAAMHELARLRLGKLVTRVRFVERNLRDRDWHQGLGEFDFVVTHQAIHELRHKRYASPLHAQVRELLRPGARYLVCDHYFGPGGMANSELYMTVDEQRDALTSVGFTRVEQVLLKDGLVLHRAIR